LYGPGEAPQRLVADVLGKLVRGEEAKTTSGEQVRDFAHVADVAAATVHVTTSPFVGAVNVGTGVPVTVREVLRMLGEITGRSDLLRLGALPQRAGDPPFICADVSRLTSLGFSPEHDLMSGLRDTLRAVASRSAG
jgi:nucleoside-diphosphate-sugar epimerase